MNITDTSRHDAAAHQEATPFQALLNRIMATPAQDKLHAWARNVKLDEEFVEDERRLQAKQDAYWEARAADRDDGEEVAA